MPSISFTTSHLLSFNARIFTLLWVLCETKFIKKGKKSNMIECHCTPTAKQIFKKSTFLSSNIATFRKIHTLFHTYKMAYLVRIMGKDYCKCRGYQNLQGENH